MKALKLTLLLVGSAVYAQAQMQTMESGGVGKSDVEKEMLRGRVKSIAVTGFTVVRKDGKLKKGREIHTTTKKYNTRGNVLESTSTEGYDTVEDNYVHIKAFRNTFKYDNNGVLVGHNQYNGNGKLEDSTLYQVDVRGNKEDWNRYKSDGTLEWNHNTEYDNQGNRIEWSEYYRGKLKNRHTYKYDDKKNIIEENFYDGDGRIKLKEVFSYDDKGNMTQVIDYNQNGNYQSRYTYKYDSKGNVVEEKAFDREKSTKYKMLVTKYDAEDNPIEVIQYGENGKVVYQCKLDKRGNHTLDVTYDKNGKLIEKITQKYVYDEKGNEIENIRYDAKGKPIVKNKYIYSYDTEKNWFIKFCYENDKATRITERIIEYY
ncbi:MAG: hypothetical protein K0Q79_3148 [Flavipsychrobacter sp.]|nr:hypothetical protein [Flavipsychrobacter sp.]